MIIFSIVILILIPFQINNIGDLLVGPRFFPYLLTISMIVFCIVSIFTDIRKEKRKEDKDKIDSMSPVAILRILITISSIVAWLLLVPILGYLITTTLFMMVIMLILKRRNILQVIIISALFTLLSYYVFQQGLNVPLPRGILF